MQESFLFMTDELTISGFKLEILILFVLIAVLLGVLIIISKNPIHSLLFLIGLFFCVSIYLITLGINFIGLSYLLVYVGAVSILFLFILMLINIRISELYSPSYNNIALAFTILFIFVSFKDKFLPKEIYNFFIATANNWMSSLIEHSQISSIGNIMYSTYSLWFLVTSLILLLAMVGAIVITIKPKKDNQTYTGDFIV